MTSSRVPELLRKQLGLARALWWAVRGRTAVNPGEVPLPYTGPDRVLLYTITVLGLLETGIVHVLVSSPGLRWTLFALGVYGLVGFVAFDFTLRQHPHVLRAGELVLRFGHFRSVTVSLENLASVRKHVQGGHKKTVQVDGDDLALSFMGETQLELRFAPAVQIRTNGGTHALTRVSFAADDARAAVGLLRSRMPAAER